MDVYRGVVSYDLYTDIKDSKTKANPAVSAFGLKGIPANFVIDGNGKTRFKVFWGRRCSCCGNFGYDRVVA